MAALIALLSVLIHQSERPAHAEFAKLVSISGGSPGSRLSSSLSTAGFSGNTSLDELTICVPSTNTNTLYLGSSSSVNASTGFPIKPGVCITYRAAATAIEASSIYTFEATTESVAVTLRER